VERDPRQLEAMSVLDKARLFQAQAEVLSARRSERQEGERVANRRAELSSDLQGLAAALAAARSVAALGSSDALPSGIDDGYVEFHRKIAQGNTSDPVFAAAMRKVKTATTAWNTAAKQVWDAWAAARIETVPANRDALLSSGERQQARERRSTLDKLRASPPSAGNVQHFKTTYELLLDTLQSQPDPSEELIELLNRMSGRVPLMLSDLSDEEIALLRATSIAEQVELRRRDV